MLYLFGGMALLMLVLGGFAGCEHKRVVTLQQEVEAKDKVIADWKEHSRVLTGAVDAIEADAKRRAAAATKAQQEQASLRAKAETELQRIANEKRSDPNDPCKSACSALHSPL